MTYVPMKNHEDYEILNEEPWTIRKVCNGREISNKGRSCDYVIVWLNGKKYYLHRLIAENFIPNPDPEHLVFVRHINFIRDDNRLENIGWVKKWVPQRFIDEYHE